MLDTIIHEIDLNMSQPNNFQYIYAMQNDYAAEYIRCTLYDGNKLYNIKCNKGDIIAKAELPTGYEALPIVYACDLNTITLKITKDITCFGGDVKIAISLLDGGAKKSTFPFILKVTDAPAGVTSEEIEYGKQAEYYANMSKSFAVGTNNVFRKGDAKDNSKYYCEEAAKSAKSIGDAEKNCAASATSAKTSADNASKSEKNAKTSETNAKTSETNSKTSETNAKNSEANSKVYAQAAESYAVGTGGYRQNEATDNSKYYYQQMKTKVDEGALAEFIYFETYSEFETEYAAGNIPANMLVVIKEHIYDKNWDNHDIIDDHLSLTSYHAVQNKVVTKEINDLKTAINNITNNVTNLETKVTALENHKCKCEDCTNYTNVPGGTGSGGGNSGGGSTTLPEPTSSDIIWLYKEGDECTSVTGGWKFNDNTSDSKHFTTEKLNNCIKITCLEAYGNDITHIPLPSFQTVNNISAPQDFGLCVQYKFETSSNIPDDCNTFVAASNCSALHNIGNNNINELTVIDENFNDLCGKVNNSSKSIVYVMPNSANIVNSVGTVYNVWFQKRGTKILSPTLTQQENPTTPPLPDKIYLYKEGDECTDITGGWEFGNGSITGKPIASNSNGKITITGNPNGQYGFLTITTINEIDTPNNYRLCIEYDMDISEGEEYVGNQTMRAYSQYSEIKFYYLKTNRVIVKDNTKLENYICERKNYKTSASVVFIDFNSIGFNSNHIVHIYNIWLEKDSSIELFE